MRLPRLLDCFSGAGGCARGFQRAGFYVVGVDINPQPRYAGDEFHQADALEVLRILVSGGTWQGYALADFAAIHASPPCPAYANISKQQGTAGRHPRLIEPVRALLERADLPYVIENVEGAKADMLNAIQLCGSSFGLRVRRHRRFECSFPVMAPPCAHGWQRSNTNRIRSGYVPPEDSVVPVYGGGQAGFDVATCREAMGIDWMTTDELNNAIPPVFAEHIGGYLMTAVRATEKAA